MPLTFTTTLSTGLAGGYAYVPISNFSRGGSFTSVSGRFGGLSLAGVSQASKTTLSKDPDIQQMLNRTHFLVRPISTKTFGALDLQGSAAVGKGTFVYVAGKFGGASDSAATALVANKVTKDPTISKILFTLNIGKYSNKTQLSGSGGVANSTLYSAPSTFVTGLFGGLGVFGNASLTPLVPYENKARSMMYFGQPVGCPINTVPSTNASYAFWS